MEPNPAAGHAGSPHPSAIPPALDEVARSLACPHCGSTPLHRSGRTLRCPSGHSFDIARQGYASLLRGHRRHRGDDAAMVAARERFLDGDHYRPLRSTLTALAAEHAPGTGRLALDLAGGTGHYLAPVVEALPSSWGLAVDLSAAALRRASRAHPRVAAVAADVWQPLPVVSGAAGVVLTVFGPRAVPEIDRVLADDGVLLVAGPAPEHLHELRGLVGTIGVDPRRPERLERAFSSFRSLAHQPVTWRLALRRDDVRTAVAMGPSAHHVDPDRLEHALGRLPELVGVTAAIEVAVLGRHR